MDEACALLSPLQDGKEEVAVKTVSKSYFRQDPKVRENLEREVRIMKLLRNCEYVVRLRHVQVRGTGLKHPSSLYLSLLSRILIRI